MKITDVRLRSGDHSYYFTMENLYCLVLDNGAERIPDDGYDYIKRKIDEKCDGDFAVYNKYELALSELCKFNGFVEQDEVSRGHWWSKGSSMKLLDGDRVVAVAHGRLLPVPLWRFCITEDYVKDQSNIFHFCVENNGVKGYLVFTPTNYEKFCGVLEEARETLPLSYYNLDLYNNER